jgi:tetratricopeptide (TPR) repeat protein
VETGAIQRGSEGWVARQGSDQLQIPPTVQALVASRLDALKSEERAVVDPASVIGLTFALDAVSELVDESVREGIVPDLDVLAAKQLVRRLPEEEVLYRFGHQIIRDTAYGSLLKRARALLHERFVTWAERVNRERGRELEFEEILGYHLEQAYQYRTSLGLTDADAIAVGERAAEKLSSAGRRALQRGDIPAAVGLLRRSTALLPTSSTFRIELLVDLADGLLQQGAFDDCKGVLEEADAAAIALDDQRLRARVRLLEAGRAMFVGGVDVSTASLEAVAAAIPVFEATGDDAGLARAARLEMHTQVMLGRFSDATKSAARIVEHARRVGEERLVSRSVTPIAYILVHGPVPVPEALERCRALVDGVQGDRKVEAILLGALAQLLAMHEELDEARATYRRAQEILGELGAGIDGLSTSIDSGRVEMLAGDLEAAERELRRDYDALAAIDERYFRSTIAAILAEVLWERGDRDEAATYATIAEEISDADDVLSQVIWRSVRAKLLAAEGNGTDGIAMALAAVEMAAATEEIWLHADALAALGEAHQLAGHPESAGPPLEEALRLYDLKGDLASADRLRARLGAPAA